MDFLYFLLYFLFWVAVFMCILSAALILTVLIAMVVGGVKWLRYTKRRLKAVEAPYTHSNAEEDNLYHNDGKTPV